MYVRKSGGEREGRYFRRYRRVCKISKHTKHLKHFSSIFLIKNVLDVIVCVCAVPRLIFAVNNKRAYFWENVKIIGMYAPPPPPATHRAHARISLRLSDAYAYKGLTHFDHSNLAARHSALRTTIVTKE